MQSRVKVNDTQFKQMVGSLMYITTTRSNLMFMVSLIMTMLKIWKTRKAFEAILMRRVLKELSNAQQRSTLIITNIDVRFHFLKDITRDGVIELVHYGTQDQTIDVMFEPLKLDSFEKLRMQLGVCEVP
ncbi:hypothetical protein CR513_59219, partial [Mucuna pruriens]